MNVTVDVSRLEALIPEIVAFGRRTVQQQCVTSAAYIVKNALENTIAIYPDSIDATLAIRVISYTNSSKTRISKAKRRTSYKDSKPIGKAVPLGVLIVMARMRPDSNYNRITGGKWKLPNGLSHGIGSGIIRQQEISDLVTNMISARRSSSAMVKAGWVKPLQVLNASPFMVRRSSSSEVRAVSKGFEVEHLGEASIVPMGDSILVTCSNLSTQGSNAALEERHSIYASKVAWPPLLAAIAAEESNIILEVEKRLAAGQKQNFVDV
jgi:hypothetical protein